MSNIKNFQSAKGVKGFLLDSFDGNYYFRVYDGEGGFKDYLLKHCDLEITINDEDAVLYERENGDLSLDHSTETLGLEEPNQK